MGECLTVKVTREINRQPLAKGLHKRLMGEVRGVIAEENGMKIYSIGRGKGIVPKVIMNVKETGG